MARKLYLLTLTALTVLALTTGCAGKGELKMAGDGDTVKVNYTGTLDDGSVFDTSREGQPYEFTLGEGKVIAGFEQAIIGMQVGEIKTVTIPAEEAYGPHREDLVFTIGREQLAEGLEPSVGQQLEMRQGDGQTFAVVVTEVTQDTITVDANHHLAGKDLTFEIELVEIN